LLLGENIKKKRQLDLGKLAAKGVVAAVKCLHGKYEGKHKTPYVS